MSSRQFFLIGPSYRRQRDANGVRRDRKTPEDITQLLCQTRLINRLALKRALSNQTEHLSRFLRKPGARIEETIAVVERRIQRAQRTTLVVVERHGGIEVTHS